MHRRTAVRAARDRAAVLDNVIGLLDAGRMNDCRSGGHRGAHPTVTGSVGGHPVTLRLVVDSLTLRKLPVLWLEVVVQHPLAVAAPLNLLRRPTGTELFSPDGRLPDEIAPPPGCPRPVRVSTTDAALAPHAAVLDPAADLLGDPASRRSVSAGAGSGPCGWWPRPTRRATAWAGARTSARPGRGARPAPPPRRAHRDRQPGRTRPHRNPRRGAPREPASSRVVLATAILLPGTATCSPASRCADWSSPSTPRCSAW